MEPATEPGVAALVAELEGPPDEEHPDVSVSHDETGWTVSAFQCGRLVLENVEDDGVEPRHVETATRTDQVRALTLVLRGDFSALEDFDWRAGYAR
jgi:hypothetical protein